MTVNVKFAKVRPDAKIPSKRDEDMGFDIYACFDEDFIVIGPHETKLIPTGIASSCNPNYGFILRERGSTGSKGIALRAGVIDSGYRNEWFVGLTNTRHHETICITKLSDSDSKEQYVKWMMSTDIYANQFTEKVAKEVYEEMAKNLVFYPYSKAIAQALVVPVPKTEVEEVTYEELQNIKSERGLGALGSSGK
jgi:dUTP pyrophosphatase